MEVLEKSSIDQIDLVSEINRLDIQQENQPDVNEDTPTFNINNEELKSIFDNKPVNQFTKSKPQSLMNRVSSFFGKDKVNEIKLDPNLNLQKDEIVEKEFEKDNIISNSNQEDQNLQNKHKDEINFDLNKNDEV